MAGHSFSKNKQNFVLVDNNLCVENMYVRIMAIVLYLSNRDLKFILWEILFCNRIRICICIRFCISISISPPCICLGLFRGRSTRSESGLQVFPPDWVEVVMIPILTPENLCLLLKMKTFPKIDIFQPHPMRQR